MSGMFSDAYRAAHEAADDSLGDARGLWTALEAVLEARKELTTSDPRNAAVWATMRAMEERLKQTEDHLHDAWEAAKTA
jgi:hypothetical protein